MKKNNSALNLWQQQVWPVGCLRDCTKGSVVQQIEAYRFNQQHAYLLVLPLLNWILVFLTTLALMMWCDQEWGARVVYLTVILAIVMVTALVGSIILAISYIYLSHVDTVVRDRF